MRIISLNVRGMNYKKNFPIEGFFIVYQYKKSNIFVYSVDYN